MKKLIYLFTVFACINTVNAQNYIAYYQNCNKGDSLLYIKQKKEALKYYLKADSMVNYTHIKYLMNIAYLSSEENKLEVCNNSLISALEQGIEFKKIKFRKLQNFKRSEYYKNFIKNKEQYITTYNNKLNQEYLAVIDSLLYIDQMVIRYNKSKTNKYDIDYSKIPNDPVKRYDLDSNNYEMLKTYIKLYGYPSEKNVGPKYADKASFLILHSARKPENTKELYTIENALKNGDCLPDEYAWIIDQNLSFRGKKLKFFYLEKNPKKVESQEELKKYNLNRYLYGIKPTTAYNHIQLGKLYGFWPKW